MSRNSRHLIGYLFISPWLIGLFAFTVFPLIDSLVLSFTDWNILEPARFVGIDNYKKMVNDDNFWDALRVTLVYTAVSLPLLIILGVLLAVLLNQKIRGMRFFRTIFYLPSVVSGVAVAMLWTWLFDGNFGLINTFLEKIGIQGPMWLSDPATALPAIIMMSLWGVGGSMIIYLAGLQGISRTLYEAAEIDGANRVQGFYHITIPMLTPTIFFNLILGVINSFQVFTQALVMTDGGPGNATLFYVLYLYQNAFQFFKMGYASTLGWVLFVIIVIFVYVIFKTSHRWVYYEVEFPVVRRKRGKKNKAAGVRTGEASEGGRP